MIFRAGFVFIIEWACSALQNRGPVSEMSANVLVRYESGVAAFLARFWSVLVRVVVRGRVRVMDWVYARTLIPPERCNTRAAYQVPPQRSLLTYCKRSSLTYPDRWVCTKWIFFYWDVRAWGWCPVSPLQTAMSVRKRWYRIGPLKKEKKNLRKSSLQKKKKQKTSV